MVIRAGIVGMSDGNGHPCSFPAIVNGYDPDAFGRLGWQVILDYLERRDPVDFGVEGLEISHIWTQDADVSRAIAKATRIPTICTELLDMLDDVDALIIARDDWRTHSSMAMPFLEAGKHVFVDKPLSLDIHELRKFTPYLRAGRLMSCAALRYAVELDGFRAICRESMPRFIEGNILVDWERYGVHLLDGIFSAIPFTVESVYSSGTESRSTILNCTDGRVIVLNCLGTTEKTFNITAYTDTRRYSHDVADNFSAFRRTLAHFADMVRNSVPPVDPDLTLNVMRTLIAGNTSRNENRVVFLDEVAV